MVMEDFVGFTYNGVHSSDLKIYRTNSGDRYDDNITATMTDKTVDVPGGDGQYYFGTTFKNRTFAINYVFDELKESDISKIKQTFNGDGIHDLIFDERPYLVWSAKVTGSASMKHLCFTQDGERIYKGEGSITFTCYYPFAHSPTKLWFNQNGKITYNTKDGKFLSNYDSTIYTNVQEWKNEVGLPQIEQQWIQVGSTSPYIVKGDKPIGIKIGFKPYFQTAADNYTVQQFSLDKGKTTITGPFRIGRGESLIWNTSTGLITLGECLSTKSPLIQINPQLVAYSGNGIVKFNPEDIITPQFKVTGANSWYNAYHYTTTQLTSNHMTCDLDYQFIYN